MRADSSAGTSLRRRQTPPGAPEAGARAQRPPRVADQFEGANGSQSRHGLKIRESCHQRAAFVMRKESPPYKSPNLDSPDWHVRQPAKRFLLERGTRDIAREVRRPCQPRDL